MFCLISSSGGPRHLGRCCITAAAIVCLGLSGCTTFDNPDMDFSQVEGFGGDAPPHWSQGLRQPDSQLLPHAVTNKGMQIERSLGVR